MYMVILHRIRFSLCLKVVCGHLLFSC